MERKHNTDLTTNARILRKNMTKEERHLWYDFLKSYFVRFLRQKVIDNYIDSVITQGKYFINYSQTYDVVNGISFTAVKIMGVCLAALVPVVLCRCETVKGFCKYVVSAVLTYAVLYVIIWIVIYIVFFIGQIFKTTINFPLNTFDALFFALQYFPIGSLIGTLTAVIVNLVLNICLKERIV